MTAHCTAITLVKMLFTAVILRPRGLANRAYFFKPGEHADLQPSLRSWNLEIDSVPPIMAAVRCQGWFPRHRGVRAMAPRLADRVRAAGTEIKPNFLKWPKSSMECASAVGIAGGTALVRFLAAAGGCIWQHG